MSQKSGFTTGTLSDDLDAKFGASRDKAKTSFLVVLFLGFQLTVIVLSLLLAIPVVVWTFVFLSEHPDFLSAQAARLLSLIL
ncbi:MAG: hypothetical protein V4713_03765 [Pseudomonadota bacterium]